MNKTLHMLLGVSFALSPIASAIAQESDAAEEQAAVERIQVTGSNIKGIDLEGSQPLTVIGADEIARSGASSISELLQNLGQTRGGSGSFNTSESGATSTSTPAGQAAASLRGLGPSSTLTLINGRRVAASSFAAGTENFVDINSIPLSAIERVEVLATGASAIYGADAVAGVINYILKKDFEGAEINASYDDSTASSDEAKMNLNFIYGTELGDGNLTIFADYFKQNAFHATDRDFTRDPALVNRYSYLPKLRDGANIYYLSTQSGNEIGNPNCTTPLVTTEFGEEICAYYGNQDDVLSSPFESGSVGFTYNAELDDINWTTDFFYSSSKSTSQSSPAPIDRIDDGEGPFAWEFALDDAFGVDAVNNLLDNANGGDSLYFDPWDIFPGSSLTVAGRQLYGIAFDARFNDPRTVEVKSDAVRLVSSLQGDWGDYQWETGVTYSRSESEQTAIRGVYNRYKVHAALAGELCSDGSIANYDSDNDVLNCSGGNLLAYYNPFLVGDSTNDATLALAQEVPTRDGTSTVFGLDAKISGELFELPAGYVGAAFGAEYRREKITDLPSANAVANANAIDPSNGEPLPYIVDVFGFGSSKSEAERTQWGAFAEFFIPITEDLNLQAAGRYDHYDNFGGTFNPMFSFSYQPIDSLMLRASWATAFRAPSLTQAGVELRTTQSQYDCGANARVSAIYCGGAGTVESTNVLQLGNNSLDAEESESVSLGLAWSPTENTTLTFDYWRFDHENLVDTNFTGLLAQSLDDHTVRFCGTQVVPDGQTAVFFDERVCDFTDLAGLTVEDAGANLDEIQAAYIDVVDPRDGNLEWDRDHIVTLQNVGNQIVEGLDLKITHDFQIGSLDAFLTFDATHYISFERDIAGTDAREELVGTYRYAENIASLKFDVESDNYFAGVGIYFVDGYEDDIDGQRRRVLRELADNGVIQALFELDDGSFVDYFTDEPVEYNGVLIKDDRGNIYTQNHISSWTTVDAYFGYDITKDTTITFNVDNVFDREPPRSYGSSRGFDSINHDVLGRSFSLNLRHIFK